MASHRVHAIGQEDPLQSGAARKGEGADVGDSAFHHDSGDLIGILRPGSDVDKGICI